MLYISGKMKKLDVISVILIVVSIIISIAFIRSFYEGQISHLKSENYMYKETLDRLKMKISQPRYPFVTNYARKDYHDYEFMRMEALREGPGEQGEQHVLTDYLSIERNKELFKEFGFFATASDEISVNRSLPDVRLPR